MDTTMVIIMVTANIIITIADAVRASKQLSGFQTVPHSPSGDFFARAPRRPSAGIRSFPARRHSIADAAFTRYPPGKAASSSRRV